MYIGDNDGDYFPLKVTAAQGKDRVWRHTGLDDQAAGPDASIGTDLVGWEWDARVANGLEPGGRGDAGLELPVNGNLLQDAGRVYTTGVGDRRPPCATAPPAARSCSPPAPTTGAAASARNIAGVGEPEHDHPQATANMLTDMGVYATTPASSIVVDAPGAPTVTARTPAAGRDRRRPRARTSPRPSTARSTRRR